MTEMIDKGQFAHLFGVALEQAARNAEIQLGRFVPQEFQIVLHGAGYPGRKVSHDEAVDALFLGEERFFKAIDVSVTDVSDRLTEVFVRASDHRPVPFEQTWSYPSAAGPFKQLISTRIGVTEESQDPRA